VGFAFFAMVVYPPVRLRTIKMRIVCVSGSNERREEAERPVRSVDVGLERVG